MTSAANRLAARVFSLADQQSFARSSGDRNPMHLDAIAARRTQAGSPVVHGMHAVLWALDVIAAHAPEIAPTGLTVRFKRFLYLDVPIFLARSARGGGTGYELSSEGVTAATIDLSFGTPGAAPNERISKPTEGEWAAEPRERSLDELRECSERFPLPSRLVAAKRFAAASDWLGAETIASLMGLSTLVGMEAPGLHSIFDGIAVEFDKRDSQTLDYAVVEIDERFRHIRMAVAGSGLAGDVCAFVRQPPVGPDHAALENVVANEFEQTRALVIGGSRGLGAATVRALTKGGASVAFTYARGEDDATRLVGELGSAVTAFRFDAAGDDDFQSAALRQGFDQLYFFATPQIARQRNLWYSDEAFAAFCAIYVDGFARTCAAVHPTSPALRIYYPSSIAVDVRERPREMLEYAMAKAAGEALCAELPRVLRGVTIEIERLPRVSTDQTGTVVPVEAASAERTALAAVRHMHART